MSRHLLTLATATVLATSLVGCWSEPDAAELRSLDTPAVELPATQARAETPQQIPIKGETEQRVAVSPRHGGEVAAPAEPIEPAIDRDARLGVKRLIIARGVSGREPVDPTTTFTAGDSDRIYAFVEVTNADRTRSEVFVSFVKEGETERGRISLNVGASPRWRTWAYTRLASSPGNYEAIVRDARGEEIARAPFTVEPLAPIVTPPQV